MPPQGIQLIRHKEILSYEEIAHLVKLAVKAGIRKIRLTGGEPLVRCEIVKLVSMLAQIRGIQDLILTTNGTLLAPLADKLHGAGLKRVNISLDTLDADKYSKITRGGKLAQVWEGILAAGEANLKPVRLNVVVIRGLNDNEVVDFARLTLKWPLEVRFIEFMPYHNEHFWQPTYFVSASSVRHRISQSYPLVLETSPDYNSCTLWYRLKQGQGRIGFISPISSSFCSRCNRLRLTADGNLRSCLFLPQEVDLKTPLRQGATDKELLWLFEQAVSLKPPGHKLSIKASVPVGRPMYTIGG